MTHTVCRLQTCQPALNPQIRGHSSLCTDGYKHIRRRLSGIGVGGSPRKTPLLEEYFLGLLSWSSAMEEPHTQLLSASSQAARGIIPQMNSKVSRGGPWRGLSVTKGRNVWESDRFCFSLAIRAGQERKICGSRLFTWRTEMLHPKLDEIIDTPHLPP